MQTLLRITENEFYETYIPIKNHLDNNASWDGCMFETYDDELTYCFELAKKENRVWTIIECDNPDEDEPDEDDDDEETYEPTCLVIASGFHLINRQGFLITEKPYEQETEVNVDY